MHNTLSVSPSEPLFDDTPPGTVVRNGGVTDTVLYILGAWTAMLSYFVKLPDWI
jgi:hypothetical protein